MHPKDVSRLYLKVGNAYQYDYQNEAALKSFDSALAYAKKADYPIYESTATHYKGEIYSLQGKYIEAFNAYKIAESLFTELQDTSKIVAIKAGLGYVFTQQELYEEATQARNEAIELAKAINEYGTLSVLYNNHSTDYAIQKDYQNSIYFAKLALKTNENYEFRDFLEVPLLSGLARTYLKADSLAMVETYIEKIKKFGPIDSLNAQDKWYAQDILSYYYFEEENYQKALQFTLAKRAEMNNQVQTEELMESEKLLSNIYDKLNLPQKRANHLSNYIELKDSISGIKKANTLAYYQTLSEKEKNESQIASQENKLAILAEKDKVKNQWILLGTIGIIGLFGGVMLYRSRNNYKQQQQLQEKFTREIMSAQEAERNRVAKDLHDGVGQKLSMMRRKAENNNQTELASMSFDTLQEIRSISRGLYPPMLQELGLTKSVEHLLLEIDDETDLFVSLEIEPIDHLLEEKESLHVYRFVQESVSNVVKHANAKTLIVQIYSDKNEMKVIVKDNGVGFNNVETYLQNSLGLKTMAERIKLIKGSFSIRTNKDVGTTVQAIIPQ